MTDSTWLRLTLITIALAAAVYLVRSFWELAGFVFDVLIVIFLAWILASSIKRLVKAIQRRMPRTAWAAVGLAYLIVILPVIALIALIVPVTLAQTVRLAQDLPIYAERLAEYGSAFNELTGSLGLTADSIEDGDDAFVTQIGQTIAEWAQDNAFGILSGATTIGVRLILVVALSVYMIVEADTMTRLFYRIIPASFHHRVRTIVLQLDLTFFSYLRGVSIVALLYSVAITALMLVAGLPFALPLGLTAGFVQLVPIVGEIAALGIPILVAFLTKSLTTAVFVAVALIVWSLVMNNLILPRILGNAVRMPGLFVLLAVVLGTRFAGVWGAILGVPLVGFAYSLVLAWLEYGTIGAVAAGHSDPEDEESRSRERAASGEAARQASSRARLSQT